MPPTHACFHLSHVGCRKANNAARTSQQLTKAFDVDAKILLDTWQVSNKEQEQEIQQVPEPRQRSRSLAALKSSRSDHDPASPTPPKSD